MNWKRVTALSVLGLVPAGALVWMFMPTPTVAPQRVAYSQVQTPFKQVRVYKTAGGLLRTETLRWQGPGSMTIVTWSTTGNPGAQLPPWVGIELQNMARQQQLLATTLQQMAMPMTQMLRVAVHLGLMPRDEIPFGTVNTVNAPPVHAPAQSIMRSTSPKIAI